MTMNDSGSVASSLGKNKIKDHVPVLINEVKSYLDIKEGCTYIDGTFGTGGHTEMILSAAKCKVISIDRDPTVNQFAKIIKNKYSKNFDLIIGRIGEMDALLKKRGINNVNGGILFDLGISSLQMNNPSRGFSFMFEGPIDMRMDQIGESAADIVNYYDEKTLAEIIHKFGEEKKARRIAKAIVKKRNEINLISTLQLAEIIRSAAGYSKNKKIDPATKTFQALRIKVNNELDEIYNALRSAEKLLTPGARLAVISFHSLEDKIVKSFLNERSGKYSNPSRYEIIPNESKKNIKPSFKIINKKVIKASKQEILRNPRSRSARLRTAERIDMEKAA